MIFQCRAFGDEEKRVPDDVHEVLAPCDSHAQHSRITEKTCSFAEKCFLQSPLSKFLLLFPPKVTVSKLLERWYKIIFFG